MIYQWITNPENGCATNDTITPYPNGKIRVDFHAKTDRETLFHIRYRTYWYNNHPNQPASFTITPTTGAFKYRPNGYRL